MTDNATHIPPASPGDPALRRRRLLAAALATPAAALVGGAAVAQPAAWPSKPLRIVVPFPPGGLTDAYARMYGEHLSRKFGQNVVVENKTGAGGTLGAADVAKSAPDGHTLLLSTTTPVWQARILYKKLPYDPAKELMPVAFFPSGALIMAVPEKLPVKTARELIEHMRRNPSNMGTYGAGSWPHMIGDHWKHDEKLDTVVVHYRGETPMWVDVVSGQVQVAVGSVQGVLPHIQRGAVRAIAALGKVRTPRLPEVPTMLEQGFNHPVFAMDGYLAMAAPAGTPADVIQKLQDGIREASGTPRLAELRQQFGIPDLPVSDAARVREIWDKDGAAWIRMAERLGITLD